MYVAIFEELGGDDGATCRFDGDRAGGAPVSVLVVDEGEGDGPDLHKHGYYEVFVILEGEADLTAGGETRRVGPGTIAVVDPETFHGFTVVGPARMRSVHIHATDHIRTTWKE
jgi:mannose-6-phosphate isomerase-like protein (cupin superfamily)